MALPGKNRVDSNDPKRGSIGTRAIANNSVRSSDIRTNNVRTSDINNGSVTGDDVDEGTLDKVPSASSADTATSATTANSAGNAGTLDGIDSTGFLKPDANRVLAVSDTSQDTDYADGANLAQLTNVPGGTYSVTAKLQVDNDGAGAETIDCDLVRPGGNPVLDTSTQTLGAQGAGAQTLNYVFTAQVVMSPAGTNDLFLRCAQSGGDNDADEMRIVVHRES